MLSSIWKEIKENLSFQEFLSLRFDASIHSRISTSLAYCYLRFENLQIMSQNAHLHSYCWKYQSLIILKFTITWAMALKLVTQQSLWRKDRVTAFSFLDMKYQDLRIIYKVGYFRKIWNFKMAAVRYESKMHCCRNNSQILMLRKQMAFYFNVNASVEMNSHAWSRAISHSWRLSVRKRQ